MKLMAEAIEIDPNPKLSSNYGVMLIQAGQPAAAATQFSNAIAGDPKFAEAYDGLGYAYEAEGRLADAEPMYRKALSLKPEFPAARDHLARLQSRQRGG
jgi:Flp pilus assembly protein TadD